MATPHAAAGGHATHAHAKAGSVKPAFSFGGLVVVVLLFLLLRSCFGGGSKSALTLPPASPAGGAGVAPLRAAPSSSTDPKFRIEGLITSKPGIGKSGEEMEFSAKVVLNGTAVTEAYYEWDFGDGTSDIGETGTKKHSYAYGGKRVLRLKVTDADGREATAEKVVSVVGAPPPSGSPLRTVSVATPSGGPRVGAEEVSRSLWPEELRTGNPISRLLETGDEIFRRKARELRATVLRSGATHRIRMTRDWSEVFYIPPPSNIKVLPFLDTGCKEIDEEVRFAGYDEYDPAQFENFTDPRTGTVKKRQKITPLMQFRAAEGVPDYDTVIIVTPR